MSKYKKFTFLIAFGLAFLFLLASIYGYYNYRHYNKWQVILMKGVLRRGQYTTDENYRIDELGQKKDYYLHLSQIFGLSVLGTVVFGTCFAFAIDLIKRDKIDINDKGTIKSCFGSGKSKMKIATKIKIYNIVSWILFGLTLLLAVYEQIKVREFNILGLLTDIILQPYLWIALILRGLITVNKCKLNE